MALRINAERIVLLGWVRAILMQIAHPLIAAGVADHSSFDASAGAAFSRLHDTIDAMLAITFGSDAERERALDGIRTIHRRVHGTLKTTCGPFEAGTPYSAEDPALLLWVHATLVESIVLVYDQLASHLTEADRDAYCAESAPVAVVLGARDADVPRTWAAMRAYVEEQLASAAIRPCAKAHALAARVLAPASTPLIMPLTAPMRFLVAGLLPDVLRDGYGLPWTGRRAWTFRAAMQTLRAARRITPRALAWWPQARAAGLLSGPAT